MPPACIIPIFWLFNSASEVTYIVSGGALKLYSLTLAV